MILTGWMMNVAVVRDWAIPLPAAAFSMQGLEQDRPLHFFNVQSWPRTRLVLSRRYNDEPTRLNPSRLNCEADLLMLSLHLYQLAGVVPNESVSRRPPASSSARPAALPKTLQHKFTLLNPARVGGRLHALLAAFARYPPPLHPTIPTMAHEFCPTRKHRTWAGNTLTMCLPPLPPACCAARLLKPAR
jgi:hypothetical protein